MSNKKLPISEFIKEARKKVLPWIIYHCRDTEEAKDIFQEVCTAVFVSYDKIDNPFAYFYTSARNMIINKAKSPKARINNIPIQEITFAQPKELIDLGDEDISSLSDLISDLVPKVLNRMDEGDRDIVVSEIYGQQTIDEVCEFHNIERRKYFYVKSRFRDLLIQLYREEYP